PARTGSVSTVPLARAAGTPASRRRAATRLLTRQDGQWPGSSSAWDEAQADATLVAAGGADRRFAVRAAAAPGGRREQVWHYPSRAECMVCHSRAANWVLGLTTLQMNREHDYGGFRANQLRTLEHLGVFRVSEATHLDEFKGRVRHFR